MSALTNDQIEELISQSLEARNFSYSPYSKFRVGAALRTVDGKIFQGIIMIMHSVSRSVAPPVVNIYNHHTDMPPMCRSPLYLQAAMSRTLPMSGGHLRFVAIAVSRQFMNEFGKNLEIFFVNDDRTYKRAVLADLLPYAFGPEDMPSK
ncbi:hypothetical protein BGZ58_006122 [Dissophora ornata]|nr:hypothetical protein BGZ58_006122 [Dissophora ornata]